jgi:hypothetical protein
MSIRGQAEAPGPGGEGRGRSDLLTQRQASTLSRETACRPKASATAA